MSTTQYKLTEIAFSVQIEHPNNSNLALIVFIINEPKGC